MDNLLNGVAMREAPVWVTCALILSMAALGSIVQWKQPSFRVGVFIFSGAMGIVHRAETWDFSE